MAAAACSSMNSQTLPPCPVESTQFGRRPRYSVSSTGGSVPFSDMNPSTSDRSIPASARARVVPWKHSSKAVLSSTRPQSEVAAPTMATRRPGILRLDRSSRSRCRSWCSDEPMEAPTVTAATKDPQFRPDRAHCTGHAGSTLGQVAGYGECPWGPASGLAHRRAPASRDGRPADCHAPHPEPPREERNDRDDGEPGGRRRDPAHRGRHLLDHPQPTRRRQRHDRSSCGTRSPPGYATPRVTSSSVWSSSPP